MWNHLYNSEIREENGGYAFNAYFSKDDGTELNTGIWFDHSPTIDEINLAVTDFYKTLG